MPVKRKVIAKSLVKKCQALKDLESGLSNKKVAEKHGGPKNTISTWTTNKALYFPALEQSSKRKKLRDNNYKQLDHINYIRRFLSQRSENIPIDGVFMKGSIAMCKGINNDM